MSISVDIVTELTVLEAQVAAAVPLSAQPFSAITAMQLNAQNLVNDIQAAIDAPNLLDTWTAPIDGASIVSGFLDVVTVSIDQQNLAMMRGVVGRASKNLDQLV